jgi:hypothetical protein
VVKIPGVKKKHLVVIAALSIVAVVTLAAYLTVLNPVNNFELEISEIDPLDLGVEEWIEDFQALYSKAALCGHFFSCSNSLDDSLGNPTEHSLFLSFIFLPFS